jgi:hypothetical protein
MARSRTEKLLGILQEHFNPREEGWLWLAAYPDSGGHGVVEQFEGPYDDPPATARGLGRIINESGADLAYLALCRQEARPTEADRALWRDLRVLASPEKLIDLVVFNEHHTWSMRREDSEAARAAGG